MPGVAVSATTTRRRSADAWLALTAGTGYAALAVACGRDPARWESRAFRELNHTGRTPALRLPQQLGTPWVLPSLGLFGFITHRPQLALSAGLALPLEKGLEVGVKKLTNRHRPAKAEPDPELLDDAPRDGPSYPSGHAAIAFCAVTLAAPYLPPAVVGVLAATAGVTAVRRIQQGAHFPLDGVGGALLGVAVGSLLTTVFGLRADS